MPIHFHATLILSTQGEIDILLFLYAVAVSRQGNIVHIYSSDTDVLVLARKRVPDNFK